MATNVQYSSDERYQTAHQLHEALLAKMDKFSGIPYRGAWSSAETEAAYDRLPEEMRLENRRLRDAMDLERARSLMDGIVGHKLNPDTVKSEITGILRDQGLDLSAIDPTGRKSATEIEQQLDRAIAETRESDARHGVGAPQRLDPTNVTVTSRDRSASVGK